MVAVVTGAAIGLPLRVSRWLVLRGGCSVVVVVMLVLTMLAMAVALLGGLVMVGMGECG